jgi:uncharacterized protein (DUF1697 family)
VEEKTVVIGREVYTFYPHGSGRSKMTNKYFEKKLAVTATAARNWKSELKLLEMAKLININYRYAWSVVSQTKS